MMGSPDELQFLANICRAMGVKKAIDIGLYHTKHRTRNRTGRWDVYDDINGCFYMGVVIVPVAPPGGAGGAGGAGGVGLW